ncbi:hypothetical protein ACIRBY_14505 [Streptomyces sp. NPDC096136]|uniref:hypothetical protein n=1 Tax=Streptomyces sp. NPDC096136 TaxID=3366076 RepID=UPI0038008408
MAVGLRVGVDAQLLDPVLPRQQVGQLVPVVDGAELPGGQQGDRLVEAALTFADCGEQADGHIRIEAPAAPRFLAPVPGGDPGGQEQGGRVGGRAAPA